MATIVLGGGLGGLAAATYLARAGEEVRVLEKSSRLGGRARTSEHEGYLFNLGPHALYQGGAGERVLGELGIAFHGKPPDSGRALALFEGRLHRLPVGPVSILASRLLSPRDRLRLGRLLFELSAIDAGAQRGQSFASWVARTTARPRLRELLLAIGRLATYIHAPDRLDAADALGQIQRAVRPGVLYLDGGWQTLVDALAGAARRAGAEIQTRAHAAKLELSGEGWQMELLRGGTLRADHVVMAIEPGEAAELRRRAGAPPHAVAVRAACLDLGLRSLPKPRARFVLGIDQPLYASVHSASAKLAPRGGAMIHVARYLAPGEESTPAAEHRASLEHLLDQWQPGWRQVLKSDRFLPRMTVMNALPPASEGGVRGRPGVTVEGAPGLYRVGDWVGGEGLLSDATLASAREAAAKVLERSGRAGAISRAA